MRDPEQAKKRLLADAEQALALSGEEKAAILPLVEKAIDARTQTRAEGDKRRDAFLDLARKAATPDGVKEKLAEYRAAREADQERVKAAQKALREVLSLEHEARLVGLGILD